MVKRIIAFCPKCTEGISKLEKLSIFEDEVYHTKGIYVKVDPLFQEADEYYKSEDYDVALVKFNQLLEFDPENKVFLMKKAMVLSEMQHFDRAIKAIDEALKLDPKNARLLFHKADIYFKADMYEKALDYIHQALDIKPNDPDFLEGLAEVYYHMEKYPEAGQVILKVLDLVPKDPLPWHTCSIILGDMDKNDSALVAVDQALKLDSGYIDAWKTKGDILERLGKFGDAKKCKDHAERLRKARKKE